MPLPLSGPISLFDIRTELNLSGSIGLTSAQVRSLAGVPSGLVVMPGNFYGKSAGPVFTITPAASSVNEGSSVTFNVGGSNIPNGTYYWTVTNAGDFGTSSGSFTITSNAGSFSVTPTADQTTEGAETFTASVRTGSTSGTVVATSSSVTINDTSVTPPPSYTITPAANNVNEGSFLTFNVGGSNIVNGTYYWTLSNTTDFATSSGSFTITSNAGSFSVTPTADSTTEGAETFTASVRTGSTSGTIVATSSSVTINDTSVTPPTYSITPAASSVNEGSSLTFNVGGSNIPNGTYYWTVTNAGDFGTSSGSFTITSNVGSFSVTPTADQTTEGAETFTASVRTGSTSGTVVATSSSVTINDTSLNPPPSITASTTTITEGITAGVTFTLTVPSSSQGTQFWWAANTGSPAVPNSNVTPADIAQPALGVVTLDANKSATILLSAVEDNTVESGEQFYLTAHPTQADRDSYASNRNNPVTITATSPTISIIDYVGVNNNGLGFLTNSVGFGDTSAALNLLSNGVWEITENGFVSLSGLWYRPSTSSIGNTHWVRFTRTSSFGGGSSASTGWLQLNISRGVSVNSFGSYATATYTVEISNSATGSPVIGSATGVTLSAEDTGGGGINP